MTRPPGDVTRLDKIKANQQAAIFRAELRNDLGWVVLLIGGWNLGLIGSAASMFFDWRVFVAGWIVGVGNMVAGVIWFGRSISKG